MLRINYNIEKDYYYWLLDSQRRTIYKVINNEKTDVKFTPGQILFLIKLLTSEVRCVNYDSLLAASHGDLGTKDDVIDEKEVDNINKSVIKIVSKIKEKDYQLGELIENIEGYGYRFIGKVEKIDYDGNKNKSEEQLTSEFGEKLIQCSRDILDRWEQQNYNVEAALLPSCNVKGKYYETLYDYIRVELMQKNSKNCSVQATGGSGKTFSLIHTCRKFVGERKKIIPIFVKMRNVDKNAKNPLCNYLYHHFANITDQEITYDPEKIYVHNLDAYLKSSGKKLLVVLDGCNEGAEESLSDLSIIANLTNTMVVLSSRIVDKKFADFIGIKVNNLEKTTVIEYLYKYGIVLEKNYDSKSLRLPIYLHIYSQVCKERENQNNKTLSIANQAEIIELWIKEQKKLFNSEDAMFAVEYYLPLLSLLVYIDQRYENHRQMLIDTGECINAIKKLSELFESEELRESLAFVYDTTRMNKNKCINVFNELILRKFAFFQHDENEIGSFAWAHECYRDWFIAKGFHVLYVCSGNIYNEYFKLFIENKFVYPTVFSCNKDYSTFAVAVYFSELVGKKELVNSDNVYFEKLLRNIIFFYEDIGDAENVIKYGNYILERHASKSVKTPVIERAITLSGLAYSYMHIHDIVNRPDCEELAKKAKEMLDQAEREVSRIVSIEYNLTIDDEKLMQISHNELIELFEKNWLGKVETAAPRNLILSNNYYNIDICNEETKFDEVTLSREDVINTCPTLDEIDLKDIEQNKSKILALLSRIYGNFGSYYLNRFFAHKNYESLVMAHKEHLLGAAYKYKILKMLGDEDPDYNDASQAFAVSMRSMGIDMFHAGNYQLSLAYFYHALNDYYVSDDIKMVLRSYICRSKVNQMLNRRIDSLKEDYSLFEIIKEEMQLLDFFEENHMFGEIDRMVAVTADIITLFRELGYIECQNSLVEFIKKIEQLHEKYFIANNSCFKLINYLEEGGENIWKKYYE